MAGALVGTALACSSAGQLAIATPPAPPVVPEEGATAGTNEPSASPPPRAAIDAFVEGPRQPALEPSAVLSPRGEAVLAIIGRVTGPAHDEASVVDSLKVWISHRRLRPLAISLASDDPAEGFRPSCARGAPCEPERSSTWELHGWPLSIALDIRRGGRLHAAGAVEIPVPAPPGWQLTLMAGPSFATPVPVTLSRLAAGRIKGVATLASPVVMVSVENSEGLFDMALGERPVVAVGFPVSIRFDLPFDDGRTQPVVPD